MNTVEKLIKKLQQLDPKQKVTFGYIPGGYKGQSDNELNDGELVIHLLDLTEEKDDKCDEVFNVE